MIPERVLWRPFEILGQTDIMHRSLRCHRFNAEATEMQGKFHAEFRQEFLSILAAGGRWGGGEGVGRREWREDTGEDLPPSYFNLANCTPVAAAGSTDTRPPTTLYQPPTHCLRQTEILATLNVTNGNNKPLLHRSSDFSLFPAHPHIPWIASRITT